MSDERVYATVTQVAPLLVRVDGATSACPARTLESLTFQVGQRIEVNLRDPEPPLIGSGGSAPTPLELNEPSWQTPTTANGWVHYQGNTTSSADPHAPLQYRKLADGLVVMRGLADGSAATADHIFTLPAGHRPGINLIYGMHSSAGYYELRVLAGGEVFAYTRAPWVSFTCSFFADN